MDMKKYIKVRDTIIGDGIPKICVPIVEKTKEEIIFKANEISKKEIDIVEWRGDYYEHISDIYKVNDILKALRDIFKDTPILFTFRTKVEGGNLEISNEKYLELNKSVIESNCIDLIDVELFLGEPLINKIILMAKKMGIKVIISNHDFDKTPKKEEILTRLINMYKLGADISKVAFMPKNNEDIISLLAASEEMNKLYPDSIMVTVSMSNKGVISRLWGEIFGSVITFGSLGKQSAPGQIHIDELRYVLNLLHEYS